MIIVHAVRDLELASGGPSRSIPQLISAIDGQSEKLGWVQHVVYRDRGKQNASLLASPRVLGHAVRMKDGKLLAALDDEVRRVITGEPKCVVHIHGLWNLDVHRVIVYARSVRVPYVISPRGMLSDWCLKHKWLKKRIGWWLYQRKDLQYASAIHATSEDERNSILRLRLKPPIIVVPNGAQSTTAAEKSHTADSKHALCITRLHPVKGLDILIDAWTDAVPKNWTLTIAGPSEQGMRERLAAQIKRSGSCQSIKLVGEVNDEEKQQLFSKSSLFVLPSRSENFGMSIAEALANGLPVITTTGTPWADIQSYQCGWFVPPDRPNLQAALKEATQCPPEKLAAMGIQGKSLISDKYSWPAVACTLINHYAKICESTPP